MQQHTPCAPDHSAMVREAWAAHLRRTAALAPGVEQRDPIRVDDAEDRRFGHEDLRPVVMRRAKTHEPGPCGEAGQHRPRVTHHPARAARLPTPVRACNSPKVTTARGQRCASGCVGMAPICASTSEHTAVDQLHGAHAALLSWAGRHVPSMDEASDDCRPAKCIVCVCKVF